MIIETFAVGLLQCNCTIIGDETSREAVVIDPGDDPDVILGKLKQHNLTLKQIICTHAHIDHVGAIYDLQQKAETPASIHEGDLTLFDNLAVQAQWLGIKPPARGHIDRFLDDGGVIGCSGVELGIVHTPGHTPGSTTFVLPAERKVLFTGDTLFLNSIGRTDLWGGSYEEIMASIQQRLMTFDDETIVITGHGPGTTIGNERRNNPFLR